MLVGILYFDWLALYYIPIGWHCYSQLRLVGGIQHALITHATLPVHMNSLILNLINCVCWRWQMPPNNSILSFCDSYICLRNIYAPQMSHTCYMPKILNVLQLGKYSYIYATYKLTVINHVIRSTVHSWWWCQWCHSLITDTELTLAKSAKNYEQFLNLLE